MRSSEVRDEQALCEHGGYLSWQDKSEALFRHSLLVHLSSWAMPSLIC